MSSDAQPPPSQQPAQELLALQDAKSSLLEQLNALNLAERAWLTGTGASGPSQGPVPGMHQLQAASRSHDGRAPAQFSRLASSLQALQALQAGRNSDSAIGHTAPWSGTSAQTKATDLGDLMCVGSDDHTSEAHSWHTHLAGQVQQQGATPRALQTAPSPTMSALEAYPGTLLGAPSGGHLIAVQAQGPPSGPQPASQSSFTAPPPQRTVINMRPASSGGQVAWSTGLPIGSGHQITASAPAPQQVLVSSLTQPAHTARPAQWLVGNKMVVLPGGQQGVVLQSTPPGSAGLPVQTRLASGIALQPQPQVIHQVVSGPAWQSQSGVITSGSLHDAGSGSLLTSVGTVYQQPATLTHLGPDSGLQHGLGAITQAVPVHLAQVGAAGTRPTIVQSVQGYPVVRLGAQPSVGSSGSKRSGASRRRKAKMYQALNAMVQSVVEQGGDQEVAEAAAAAAAATLKGGVPNRQGGSAACASVVQAVFQQRLQLQTALRQMQRNALGGEGQGVVSAGALPQHAQHVGRGGGIYSQPILGMQQQLLLLQQQQRAQQQQREAFASEPASQVSLQGNVTLGPLPAAQPGQPQQAGLAGWPASLLGAGGGGSVSEADLQQWQALLSSLQQLEADMSGRDSNATDQAGADNDADSEDEGDALVANVDLDDLGLLNLNLASGAALNILPGPGLALRAGSSSSREPLSGLSQGPPSDLAVAPAAAAQPAAAGAAASQASSGFPAPLSASDISSWGQLPSTGSVTRSGQNIWAVNSGALTASGSLLNSQTGMAAQGMAAATPWGLSEPLQSAGSVPTSARSNSLPANATHVMTSASTVAESASPQPPAPDSRGEQQQQLL